MIDISEERTFDEVIRIMLGLSAVVGMLMLLGFILMVSSFAMASQSDSAHFGPTEGSTAGPEETDLPENVVVEPESGQLVLVNELAILASGQDVSSLIADFGGEITVAVPQTDTYQVRFPVSCLAELDAIAAKLEQQGVRAQYVMLGGPLSAGGP